MRLHVLKLRICISSAIFLLLVLLFHTGCSKMNDTYKQFLEDGPVKYLEKPDSVLVYPGKERILLSWAKPSDPKVKGAIVYWNNGADSSTISFSSTNAADTIKFMLDNMPEGEYVFQFHSTDDLGNLSLGKEIIGRSYGVNYAASLLSRPLDSTFYYGVDTLQLNWGGIPDTSIVGTEIVYTDLDNITYTKFINDSASSSFLYNFNGGVIRYRTVYIPERKAIDTFYTDYESMQVEEQEPVKQIVELQKSGWTATASSFDSRSGASYRPPQNAIDNNTNTLWVNFIGTPAALYPHWLQVDMGSLQQDIDGIAVVTRVGDPSSRPKTVEFLVSEDGDNWQSFGDYDLANSGDKQLFDFPSPMNIRYFKMIAKNAYDNGNNIAFAEIGVYRYE